MNLRDQLGGLFWLGISVFVCIDSLRNGIGTFHSPGPGFFPFWSGVILGMLSIILVAKSMLKREWKGNIKDLWEGAEWNKVIWTLCSLFLYSLLLPIIGYLITTFGLMFFLIGMMGRSKVWIRVISAFIIVLVSYFIFYFFLDVRLPKGIFGF